VRLAAEPVFTSEYSCALLRLLWKLRSSNAVSLGDSGSGERLAVAAAAAAALLRFGLPLAPSSSSCAADAEADVEPTDRAASADSKLNRLAQLLPTSLNTTGSDGKRCTFESWLSCPSE
jgi:hypothetical protein